MKETFARMDLGYIRPDAPKARERQWKHRPLENFGWIRATLVVGVLSGSVMAVNALYHPGRDHGHPVAVSVKQRAALLKPANEPSSRAAPVAAKADPAIPKWIQAGIVALHDRLDTSEAQNRKLMADDQAMTKQYQVAQVDIARLQSVDNTQAGQIQALRRELSQLRLQQASTPAVAAGAPPRTAHNEIVAINVPHAVPAKKVTATSANKKQGADGWMLVAVSNGKAVVQAPDGQVSVVQEGTKIDGAKVTGINAVKKTVVLNGNQVISIAR